MSVLVDNFMKFVSSYVDADAVETVYDIGAGSSEETVEMRERFPNAQVYAFECNPVCILNCTRNIINLDRITLLPICVNNYTGLVTFHPINQEKTLTTHEDGNPRASSLFMANGTYPHETYVQDSLKIPCMTIGDMIMLFDLPKPEIVWMDLQGAELAALQGIGDLSSIKVIHTEVTNKEMYTGQAMYKEVKKYLEDNNFVCFLDDRSGDWIWDDADCVRADLCKNTKRAHGDNNGN